MQNIKENLKKKRQNQATSRPTHHNSVGLTHPRVKRI